MNPVLTLNVSAVALGARLMSITSAFFFCERFGYDLEVFWVNTAHECEVWLPDIISNIASVPRPKIKSVRSFDLMETGKDLYVEWWGTAMTDLTILYPFAHKIQFREDIVAEVQRFKHDHFDDSTFGVHVRDIGKIKPEKLERVMNSVDIKLESANNFYLTSNRRETSDIFKERYGSRCIQYSHDSFHRNTKPAVIIALKCLLILSETNSLIRNTSSHFSDFAKILIGARNMSVPPCSCPVAGFCSRHNITRGQKKWQWCQKDDNYRAQWDKIAEEVAHREGREPPVIEEKPSEEEIPKDPSLVRRAGNLFNAMKDVALNYAKTGEIRVDGETYQKRLEICRSCPSDLFDATKGVCRHMGCGCFLSKKAKLIATSCPMKHWEDKGV
jgi:hypothetical protein